MRSILFLVLGLASTTMSAQDRYHVEFDQGLNAVAVRACFEGTPPERLYHHSEAAGFADLLSLPGGKKLRIRKGRGSTPMPTMKTGSCVEWRVDLARVTSIKDSRTAIRVGDDLVTDTDLWFWRGPGERPVRVEVKLPRGMGISTPWRQVSRAGNALLYEPAGTPATWASRTAVGKFSIQQLEIDGTEIRLAILGALAADQQQKLAAWINQAARAVAGVYGQYPQNSPQVLLIPVGERNEAVPWAHVMRGGGVGAEFFVDETSTLEELTTDWTACHELSHMFLPFISSRDRWLSEGLASYYQYVLLARSGTLSEQDAWQGLFEGFRRGEKDSGNNTLAEATQQGWEYTMRVYWSGAAMMLMADTQLRALSGGRQSLDSALAALGDCCMDSERRWRALNLFRQLDRITGTQIFTALYEKHVPGHSFPDLTETWRSLGIMARFNRVRLSDEAPLATVRSSIMGG